MLMTVTVSVHYKNLPLSLSTFSFLKGPYYLIELSMIWRISRKITKNLIYKLALLRALVCL